MCVSCTWTSAHDVAAEDGRVRLTIDSAAVASALPELARRNAVGLRIAPPSLEELFLRHYGDELGSTTPTATAQVRGSAVEDAR